VAPAPRPPASAAGRRDGIVLLATVVLAWGLVWPVNKVLLDSLSPLWLVAVRSAIASLALFGLMLARGRLIAPPRADVPVVLSITLLHMVAFATLSTLGLQLVPTGRSVVLAYTTPLWVTPGAVLLLGERFTARRMLGMAAGLAGLAVLFNPLALDWRDGGAVAGNLAIVAAALLWAASILHVRGHRWRSTPLELVPWETLLATLLLSPIAYLLEGPLRLRWSAAVALLLLYAAVPGTAVAYWAMAMAGQRLPAITTSLGLLATPLVSIVVATLWLREPLTLSLLAAVVLILGGVALGLTGGAAARRDETA
jgi:drug/metabolite transporter (DMT)-like permease